MLMHPLIAQMAVITAVYLIIVRTIVMGLLLQWIILGSQVVLWVLLESGLWLMMMMCTCAGSLAERGDTAVVRGWCASLINSISIFIFFSFAADNDLGR